MKKAILSLLVLGFCLWSLTPQRVWDNPWNGKVVLQAFWWDCWNETYPQDWYTYLAKLAPRLRADKPNEQRAKSTEHGRYQQQGSATNEVPVSLEFTAEREGYHRLSARFMDETQAPTRAYLKVEYEAPATSEKF